MMNSDIADTLSNLVGSEYDVKKAIDHAWHKKYNDKLEKKRKYAKTSTSLAVVNDHDEAIQTILSNDNPGTVGEFHSILQTQFKKPEFIDDDAIRMSSGHGSKGLQHPHTVIYGTNKFPHPKAQLPWEREAEANLYYVVQTRCLCTDDPSTGTLELIESNE
jgi:superfamily I DNA/RNA helicase